MKFRDRRRSLTAAPADYDWDMMLATGRNNYGDPDQVIQGIHNAAQHYYFDTLTTTFNFGGIPHGNREIHASVRQGSDAGVQVDGSSA